MVARKTRKAIFWLDAGLLAEVSEAVNRGAAVDENAFVDRALRRELAEALRHVRRALWQQAAQDPLFQHDIVQAEADFAEADAETARNIG